MYQYYEISVADLLGRTISKIVNHGNDELRFYMEDGDEYLMYHSQDCCESVTLEDVAGDLDDLIGSPLLMAEEVSDGEDPENWTPEYYCESYTWTYYKFATIKGSVTLRWFGSSNGYYSERVDFVKVNGE